MTEFRASGVSSDTVNSCSVLTCDALDKAALLSLLQKYRLRLLWLPPETSIPGSYWGESEAGLIGQQLIIRDDTPVHSALHEACHYICMDAQRRAGLHTDAGGDDAEENGVCYLQILLADYLPGIDRERLLGDMDTWGYSFRLGSARTWFEQDAEDARSWLLQHALIDNSDKPIWRLRHR
jgi:hypothetical protein